MRTVRGVLGYSHNDPLHARHRSRGLARDAHSMHRFAAVAVVVRGGTTTFFVCRFTRLSDITTFEAPHSQSRFVPFERN